MKIHLSLIAAFLSSILAGPAARVDLHVWIGPMGNLVYKQQEWSIGKSTEQMAVLPEVPIDFKTTIDTLADYGLDHEKSTFFGNSFYGVTDYNRRTIHISDNFDLADRRETIIHELYHVAYRNIGLATGDPKSEMAVEEKAQALFKKTYSGAK